MKLLSLYYTHKPGGFCKRLYRLLSALAARGHTVTYLTLDPPPASLSPAVQVRQIPFFLKSRRGFFFWTLFTLWCPFYVALAAIKIKPDRYVLFGPYYSSMLIFARRVAPAQSILFLRAMLFWVHKTSGKFSPLNILTGVVEKYGMISATRLVCLTQVMADAVKEFCRRSDLKIDILHNDVPKIAKKPKNALKSGDDRTLTILTSGVIDWGKNIELILRAFAGLGEEDRLRVQLLVAGDGPMRRHLEDTVQQLGLKNVTFLGWVSDFSSLYPQVDLVVHPSHHEGMPNSVLEALGAEIPVLVSNTPELAELLPFAAARFSPKDPAELADKFHELLSSPTFLSQLRAACATRAAELSFDWDDRAAALVERQ